MTISLFYEEMRAPIGTLTLFESDQGLCLIQFGSFEDTEVLTRKWLKRYMPEADLVHSASKLSRVITQLQQYFAGERTEFELDLEMRGTPFQVKVWNALRDVAYGKTETYKGIAEQIGQKTAVRAVGGANNRNPLPLIVPCHRIVGSDGSMTGYAGGISVKETLLRLEERGMNV